MTQATTHSTKAEENGIRRGRPSAGTASRINARILEAAWQHLLTAGPERFSLDRVATLAHASKQTVYARFSSKVALLRSIALTRIDAIIPEIFIENDIDDIENAFTDLAKYTIYVMASPEGSTLIKLIDYINVIPSIEMDSNLSKIFYDKYHMYVEYYFRFAESKWNINIENIPYSANFWLDGIIGHVRGWHPYKSPDREWPVNYSRFFLRAVCPDYRNLKST